MDVDAGTVVDMCRKTFQTGKTKSLEWRRKQLTQLQLMIEEGHEKISAAIAKDLGGPKVRATFDHLGIHEHAQVALDNLSSWSSPEYVPHTEMFGSSHIRRDPKGVVLVVGPWNFPVFCLLCPLVAVIASGNCAVLKPSEVSENVAIVIQELVEKYLDTEAIAIYQGGVERTTSLLTQRFDSICYTGNGVVASIIMKAAAKHLTPCVMELGGKSPVIIDESADIECAAQRIALSKFMNNGQICVSSDYILIHKSRKAEFVKRISELLKKTCDGDASSSSNWGKIINERHTVRISKLVESTSGKPITPCLGAGKQSVEIEKCFLTPTLIDEPSFEDEVMKDEIFGPVLPIIAVDSLEQAVEHVKVVCPQPLALYIFAQSTKAQNYVLDNTESGGVCINSTLEHLTNIHLPFGGVGSSGHGSYYGKIGFDTFSNRRSVYNKSSIVTKEGVLPLPGAKGYPTWLYDAACKLQFGFVPRAYRLLTRKQFKWAFIATLVYMLIRRRI